MINKIEIIEDFLGKLGIEVGSIEKKESDLEGFFVYTISTPDAGILIGGKGETLSALSHIVRKVIEKSFKEDQEKFFIDIGDYQNKRIKDIKNKAVILAERARFFKKDVEMPPMNPYERMIVHSVFSNYLDIKTESYGKDYDRRVIIKYVGQ